MVHLVLAITFDSSGIFSCFFYVFAGMIAGTFAHYVVRGRLGCLFGNFFLGIAGAIAGGFLLNFLEGAFPHLKAIIPDKTGFFGTTLIATIMATLISFIVTRAMRAERRHQQRLLEKYNKSDT